MVIPIHTHTPDRSGCQAEGNWLSPGEDMTVADCQLRSSASGNQRQCPDWGQLYTAIPLSLFTTVTNWEQPKCPSVEDRVSKAETDYPFSDVCSHER